MAFSSTPLAHVAASGTGASTGATTAAIDTTGAKLIIVGSGNFVSSSTLTVTDNKSNTWTKLPLEAGASNARATLWYCNNPTVGTGHTFTLGGTNGYVSFAVAAFGAAATGATPFGQVATIGVPASSPFVNTVVAPLADGALLVTVGGYATSAQTLSISSPFTLSDQKAWVNSQCQGVGLAYYVQGAHTGVAPAWSWASGTNDFGSLHVAFMEAGTIPLVVMDTQEPRLVVATSAPSGLVTQLPRLVIAPTAEARATNVYAELVIAAPPDLRATATFAEIVLREVAEELRLTQVVAELVLLPPPEFNITQAPRLVVAPLGLAPLNLTQAARLSVIEVGSPVRATQDPRLTALMTPTAPPRLGQLPRLVVMGPAGAQCFGGSVPRLPDPAPGVSFPGLGPHEDRVFIETDLGISVIETVRWALQTPLRDRPDLATHPGFKDGRIVTIGNIIRRTTGRLGGWQSSTCRWTADDTDRLIRASLVANHWYGSEFRLYIAKRGQSDNAAMLGRFFVSQYPPGTPLTVDVEGLDLIGSDFSLLSAQRDIMAGAQFDLARFPALPKALAETDPPPPIPIYMGQWSDEASGEGSPTFAVVPWRGGAPADPGGAIIFGFGNMPPGSPAPPTTVTAHEVPGGGAMMRGVSPHNKMFFSVWGETGGLEGDSTPFYMGPVDVVITTDHTAVKVDWTFSGTNPTHWRIGLACDYYGPRYDQVLEVAGSARTVTFTNMRFGTGGGLTPGATNAYQERREFILDAIMPDGRTGTTTPIGGQYYGGPYKRPVHVAWYPIPGAISYELITGAVPALAYFGWSDLFSVPADSIDSDGLAFYDYAYGSTGTPLVDGKLPVPVGMLPSYDTGDEVISGQTYARFVVSRWPFHKWIGIRQAGNSIAPSCLYPGGTWPFPDKFRTIGGCDLNVFYVLASSPIVTAVRTANTPIYVNACTTEDMGNALGSTITNAARAIQHLVTQLLLLDHQTGLWAGIPLWSDGIPKVRPSDYVAAEAMQIARVGGEGYTARIALVAPMTVAQFFQNSVQSFGLHHGIGAHGQIRCGHYDDGVSASVGYPHFTDLREIKGPLRITPRTEELENWIPYQADYRPIEKSCALTKQVAQDPGAITANHGRKRVGQGRTLAWAHDPTTINDVMQRALLLGRYVREWVEVPTDLDGLSIDVFSIIRVTDAEGLGASGYQEQFILVLEHEVRPGDPGRGIAAGVTLRGLDITALADAAWVWGPDSILTWDTMTDEEKGLYGAWATDSDTIPTSGEAAKEFR